MKKVTLIIFASIFSILLISGCSSTNHYMVRESQEYAKVTQNFLGEWQADKYTYQTENYLDDIYEKITAEFDFDSRNVDFTFYVAEEKLEEKLEDWEEKYPDLEIDEYKIVLSSQWYISESGDILHCSEQEANIFIEGTGENFEGFYGWERSKFEMGKSAGSDGGLLGMAMSKVAKDVTGTSDLFPELSDQFNFEFSDDFSKVKLKSLTMEVDLFRLD